MKISPVTARTRTSKASWVRSLPSPRWVLLQSLRPVKLQAGRGRCFRGAIRRFRKSPSTCHEVRPLSASDLILPSTESNSGCRDGLALQDARSVAGPSVGKAPLVGFGGGDHPILAPLLPLPASKAGNVRRRRVAPCLEII